MQSWGVIVCLAAIAGIQVFADLVEFPENVQSLSGARIVSGWEAQEGQIPWQLSLRMVSPVGAVSSCGGSIIHSEWGLTAAHCTATRVTMVLRAGAVSLWRPELIYETTVYYNHPDYIDALQSIVQPHDISILKFQRTITFSHRIQPIRVQKSEEKNRNYDRVRLIASGWGRTWTNGATPENLQWVYLSGDSNDRCRSAYSGSSIIVDSTICASYYNVTSQSTCQGDSGGPLFELEADGQHTLVGVTSFVSAQGCHVDMPAGFIRPGHYHDWITEVTGIDFDNWAPEPPTTEKPDSSSESNESSESKSSESKSSESKSSESKSSESKSSESKSSESDSKSSESESKESKSSESESKESKSSESESKESKSSESNSNESKPSESKSSESDSKSSESESKESKSSESNSNESKPSESKSSESKSSESKSSESETNESKSSESETNESKSSESNSNESKPSESNSNESKPSESKSSESNSNESKPSESKSSESKESKSSETNEESDKSEDTNETESKETAESKSEESEETEEEQQSRLFWSVFRDAFTG